MLIAIWAMMAKTGKSPPVRTVACKLAGGDLRRYSRRRLVSCLKSISSGRMTSLAHNSYTDVFHYSKRFEPCPEPMKL